MKRNVIIFDRQDITRVGIETLIRHCLQDQLCEIVDVDSKQELIGALSARPDSMVVLDYSLSDLNSADTLLNISARFNKTHWILFSEELSIQFLKKVVLCNHEFSVVLKSSDRSEIENAIIDAIGKEPFICSHVKHLLSLNPDTTDNDILTITEKEILKEMAFGKTAKEIAVIRNISVFTVVTHRKNIYRKLDVNNVQEASRYALRAGIVDASDFYI